MAWTGRMTAVNNALYGAVNITVEIKQDSPALTFTTQVGFNKATELDWVAVEAWIKAEIARVSGLYGAGETLKARINTVVTP